MYPFWTVSRRGLALAAVIGALVLATTSRADPLTSWTPGPNAVLDNTYDGYIDVPTMNATVPTGGFLVAGWIVDKTADGWAGVDGIQVWLGNMDSGSGGRLLVTASLGQSRPDVAAAEGNPFWAASGFAGFVPAEQLPPGPQTLSVYAHTPAKGWWYKQVNVTVASPTPVVASSASSKALPIIVIERPRDNEVVPTTAAYQIAGYALDPSARPDQGTGIGRVQVYAGGERDTGTFLGNAELDVDDDLAAGLYGPQFATAGWRLTFHPTQFHTSTHLVFAYAISAINGQENLTQRYFNIRETP